MSMTERKRIWQVTDATIIQIKKLGPNYSKKSIIHVVDTKSPPLYVFTVNRLIFIRHGRSLTSTNW